MSFLGLVCLTSISAIGQEEPENTDISQRTPKIQVTLKCFDQAGPFDGILGTVKEPAQVFKFEPYEFTTGSAGVSGGSGEYKSYLRYSLLLQISSQGVQASSNGAAWHELKLAEDSKDTELGESFFPFERKDLQLSVKIEKRLTSEGGPYEYGVMVSDLQSRLMNLSGLSGKQITNLTLDNLHGSPFTMWNGTERKALGDKTFFPVYKFISVSSNTE